MSRKNRILTLLFLVAVALAVTLISRSTPTISSQTPYNKVLAHQLAVELGQAQLRFPKEQRVSAGVMYALLQATGEIDRRGAGFKFRAGAADSPEAATDTSGCQYVFTGADGTKNVRVNQDCSYRRQAEEVVAVNPNNPDNLIVGQNDSRVGFNHCGYAWSLDGGSKWGDQIPPFYQFILADGAVADACSDPTATFDSIGSAYIGGILFEIYYPGSAFIVMKSNPSAKGKFYHNPDGNPLATSSPGVIANDADPYIFHDKEYLVADSNPSSPKASHVYGTWTRFNGATGEGVGGNSPIYFSQSTDLGVTWSPGIEISGSNSDICTDYSGSADANACDQDQGSHPIVGPDGTVYVVFGNGNTPTLGINQVLFVKCEAGNDCSNPASWSTPVKVGDLYGTHPLATGANAAGCPVGRQCIPPNGYRAPEFTGISVAVQKNGNLYTTWWDTRNLGSNCTGDFSTATPPCDTDVFYSYSKDGGATWADANRVSNPGTSQWQSWSTVIDKDLWIAYYDRKYGDCETTGCHDITLVKVKKPASDTPTITRSRITTSSMPDLNPSTNPYQAGFIGDYMWIANQGGYPVVVWADTRGRNSKTPEEDIYIWSGYWNK